MRPRVGPAFSLAALLIAGAAAWAGSRAQQRFDHLRHQRMFPTCDGCHQVEPSGVTMPEPGLCAQCHDGAIAPRVDWRGPEEKPSNLDFDHSKVLAAKEEALGMRMPCRSCHVPQGAERMDVKRALVDGCLACHATGQSHYVGAPCRECHVPLTRAEGFTTARVRDLPRPADHEAERFLLTHGEAARTSIQRCAVCHARELCSSCHVDAPAVPEIQALSKDPRVAAIASEREPSYPVPASHRSRDWSETHAAAAREAVSDCTTCHARNSCRSCHVEPVPGPVREVPPGPAPVDREGSAQERGPGVTIERRAPRSHGPFFLDEHRALAAGATVQCRACHTRDQCTSCHTGSEALVRPGADVARYHPVNFMQQHSAPGFSREVECASCHNTEAFCRSCHEGQGLSTGGRIDTGFHDESPNWIFGHGMAARQGLETCATCHSQRDCLVCHSAIGGRRVNPHGRDFDADRLAGKNPALCLRCHRPSILER